MEAMQPSPIPAQQIAIRAYAKWQARGCPMGDDLHDWFEAEEELRREAVGAPRPKPLS